MTDSKRPTGKPPAKELLNDLQSVQSLLNAPAVGTADWHDDVPSLAGDGEQQIPLLTPNNAPPEDATAALRQAIAARENPFLSKAAAALPKQPKQPAPPPPAPAARGTEVSAAPDESEIRALEIRALIDALIAEWLPRIEQELRTRLKDQLTRRNPPR